MTLAGERADRFTHQAVVCIRKIVMTHERPKWGVNLTISQPEDVSLQTKGANTSETHETRVSLSFCNLHRRMHRRAQGARSNTSSHWN
jgi:hypothetical protein